ncbi:MAG: hypothetical protein JWL90_1449 [Chthoniobacteraceae bacterium]|nr:hypothetical protein [Chthoniobacteraceae bacterium]
MPTNTIAAFGWEHCAQLSNAHAELLVTLDVGPRILSYKTPGGRNVLNALPESLGTSGESEFVVRGGHRLWVSPEDARSYAPDNGPVKFEQKESGSIFVENAPAAPWQVRKAMTISLSPGSSAVRIEHRLTNEGAEPITVSAWALTVMAPGGLEVIPQPPLGEHGKGAPGREFLPTRVIVPWSFTDLSDERWKIGRRFITLRAEPGRPATKLGLLHSEGWAGYILPGALFIKTFVSVPDAVYPDFGCNFETFTKDTFLEMETLSPLRRLEPGQSVDHVENWHLFDGVTPPDSLEESVLEEWFVPFLAKIGL